jgi:hypothetical protein
MYVPISQRSLHEVDELRVAAADTLTVLELALTSAVDRDMSTKYGVDLADVATLADVTAALHQFLERECHAGQA